MDTKNEATQLYQLRGGLWEQIKDELACVEMPMGLDAFVDLTICIDNSLREQKEEKGGCLQPSLPRTMTPASVSPTKPMQASLTHHRLTPQENEQRCQCHLCVYCGETGHVISACLV
ncbi:unnamed protein product [Caretta caretta]